MRMIWLLMMVVACGVVVAPGRMRVREALCLSIYDLLIFFSLLPYREVDALVHG